jgi:YHS domain-containing protein
VPAADFLLEHLSRTLMDPVDPRRVGSLDARLHARVNGEIYRFSRSSTRTRFLRDPVRWCGILRDPVSSHRFEPDRFSPRFEYSHGPYFFISDSTRAEFQRDPERYAIHRDD